MQRCAGCCCQRCHCSVPRLLLCSALAGINGWELTRLSGQALLEADRQDLSQPLNLVRYRTSSCLSGIKSNWSFINRALSKACEHHKISFYSCEVNNLPSPLAVSHSSLVLELTIYSGYAGVYLTEKWETLRDLHLNCKEHFKEVSKWNISENVLQKQRLIFKWRTAQCSWELG